MLAKSSFFIIFKEPDFSLLTIFNLLLPFTYSKLSGFISLFLSYWVKSLFLVLDTVSITCYSWLKGISFSNKLLCLQLPGSAI